MSIKLTAYSHGAGCGCKLSPSVLQEILKDNASKPFPELLVGNETKDDAAVYRFDEKYAIISTTDFFMPIVDDPKDFGAIAATNAISDVYAMGGTPLMAIAILGWPIDKLSTSVAAEVMQGGNEVCHKAGIPIAGGHSIDAPEPIFGLAVTGKVLINHLKNNNKAKPKDLIYISKPLGIGLVTTAQKKGLATKEDLGVARESMLMLNDLGASVANLPYVHAVTDVTGFGLAGHLLEVLEASQLSAKIQFNKVPRFSFVNRYLTQDAVPGGTIRNWKSYGHNVELKEKSIDYRLLADPQTSGGLLMFVDPDHQEDFEAFLLNEGYPLKPFGTVTENQKTRLTVESE